MKVISEYMGNVRTAWDQCWADRSFKIHLAVTVIGFLLFLRYGIQYISLFEYRQGRILSDPVLESLSPRDFSPLIFGLIHTSIVITAVRLFASPSRFLLGLQACLAILVVRTFCIYLVPLEPPPGMILLKDPFISLVFGSETNVAVKDLFFSGHVSTMCVLFLVTEKGFWRKYLFVATTAVAVLIAWQHVHYTIDIVAAPVFGVLCCKGIDLLHTHPEYGLQRPLLEFDYEEIR